MADSFSSDASAPERGSAIDVGFAFGIIFILTVLFLPLPSLLIDICLTFSIALAVLILMVALWIAKPLDFSAFPTVLLIATRFLCILTVGLVMFGTGSFLGTLKAMRALGLPAILTDMALLAFRYLHEIWEFSCAIQMTHYGAGKSYMKPIIFHQKDTKKWQVYLSLTHSFS